MSDVSEIRFSPDAVFRWLLGIVTAALLLYLSSYFLGGCATAICGKLKEFVHLDREANLPSWISASLWLLAAMAALPIALGQRKDRRYWLGLAILFAFLSLDEAAMFHERFGDAFGAAFSGNDYLFYNWLLYGLVFIAAIGLIYLPFLWHLPRSTRRGLLVAGGVFVGGAIGVEMIGAAVITGAIEPDHLGIFWRLQLMAEEGLEMLGLTLLIRALLRHLANFRPVLRIRIGARAFRGHDAGTTSVPPTLDQVDPRKTDDRAPCMDQMRSDRGNGKAPPPRRSETSEQA
jgi:hypothetical protein